MRLAVLHVDQHPYLFNGPQTINFGGQYIYHVTREGDDIIVMKTQNKNFIEEFFDLTLLESKLTNLNAIVGQNGAGKSTILDIIRSQFIPHKYALPHSRALLLIEDENQEPAVLRNDFANIYVVSNETSSTRIRLDSTVTPQVQTVYYSPHYDYKFNPDFDMVDDHDISFDRLVDQDLQDSGLKNTNRNGWAYSVSQQLLFKNSLRQIYFLKSDLVTNQQIFKNIFQLQDHYEPVLYIRQAVKRDNWNTPMQFRGILKMIEDKAEQESDEWTKLRDEDAGQLKIDQYLLKRFVIECIISLFRLRMEDRNTYLEEGHFPEEEYRADLQAADAYQSLLIFVRQSTIRPRNSPPAPLFPAEILSRLLEKLYAMIDKVSDEDSITKDSLKASPSDTLEILRLQKEFMTGLNTYYSRFSRKKDEPINDSERKPDFISYMPFSRRMSSGENALLNLFSRIYDFLQSNLGDVKYREPKSHYILLLDEGDSGFHPAWKKKFVKAILSTLPCFFDKLENKPSIEIIFTTHDPLTLSDLPNSNVIYIERADYDSPSTILDLDHPGRPVKTFGANISELIADSFFIQHTLIGDFAFDKIQKTIDWLNNKADRSDPEYHQKVIQIIDEPIVQRKLAEMYDEKMRDNFQLDILNDQIKQLEKLKQKL